VIHHDFQVLALSQFDQLLRLLGSRRKRLFNEYVLAIFEGGLASSKWVQTGVTTATMSMLGERRTCSGSEVTSSSG